jgi:hypothetical protein
MPDPFNVNAPGVSYSGYPSELQQQASDIARRRAITDILLQQSMQQPQTTMVRGIPVRHSPLEYLSKTLSMGLAAKGMGDVNEQSMGLAQKYQGMLGQAVQDYATTSRTDPQGAAARAVSSGFPQLQHIGAEAFKPYNLSEGGKRFGPGGVVAEVPKTVSPGEIYRQEQENIRHAEPSGSARLSDERMREMYGMLAGQTLEPSTALVDAIGKGDIPLNPPPTNMRNPMVMQQYGKLLAAIKSKYPDWSDEMFPAIKGTVEAYAKGKQGDSVRFLNASIDHLGAYEELAKAMKSGDVQAINKAKASWERAFGQPAPTNLAIASQFVGNEVVKAITVGTSAEHDRAQSASAFSVANSPEQAISAAKTARTFLGGQLRAHEQQYKAGTYGRRADFREKYLTPAAREAFSAAERGFGGGTPGTSIAPAGIDPKVWAVMTPQEQALFKK